MRSGESRGTLPPEPFAPKERNAMSTTTIQTMVKETTSPHPHGASQIVPFLVAMVFVAVAAVVSVLISGPLN
jgi:hypothetical protein